MYISRTKKKGKKGKKRKKKITVAFPPAIPSVSAYFLEFGTEDRPLLKDTRGASLLQQRLQNIILECNYINRAHQKI